MKITEIVLKSPLEKYTEDVHFESLDLINVILGKNNSGKTRTLKQMFSALSKEQFEGYEDSSAVKKITFEMSGKELEMLLLDFRGDGLPRSTSSLVSTILQRLKDDDFLENFGQFKAILSFERQSSSDPFIVALDTRNCDDR
ncbi:MAG: hypothetical protein ACFE8P_16290, partial [Promethearchaeota archaeon]